ncbi:3-dehydroquinate synthase [Oscillospiraceae bacterium]|nr:3-dehydroquinate synthase [Oscillospiraceae bacterium]
MKTLRVSLQERSYDIQIAPGLLTSAGEAIRAVCPKATRLFVVTDSNVHPLYAPRLEESLTAAGFQVQIHVIPAGEASKSALRLSELWEAMLDFGLTRTDAVVALGGGVVGDLAGFAAATVLRGVDFIQLPTTLLAQVDSSVGGKVAVDLRAGKNLAGAFWQPRLVLMDTDTLATLPDATFSDGMAEVIKYGCIWDKFFFDFLAARPTRAALTAEIESILYTCCEIKRQVVESDERDTGKRMLLNFGHTLGHAYELAGNYEKWTHGQAVAAGMVAAARLGVTLGVTPADVPAHLEAVLAALDLPTAIPCGRATYAAAIGRDKKGAGEDISLILLESLGRAVIQQLPKAELLELL